MGKIYEKAKRIFKQVKWENIAKIIFLITLIILMLNDLLLLTFGNVAFTWAGVSVFCVETILADLILDNLLEQIKSTHK